MADENGRGRGDGERARDKGKGKSKDNDNGRQAGGGLLSSVASAGAGGMPGELARMLASQGKASSVGPGAGAGAGAAGVSGGMAGAYIDDARAAAVGAIPSRSSAATTGFRSVQEAPSGVSASAGASAGERSYAGFAAPPAMATAESAFLGQADARVGPYSSASDLDAHLHDHVRRSSQQQQRDDHWHEAELEGAWRDARQQQPQPQQRQQGFDPMTMLDVESEDQHEFAQDDFIAALEREERELPPRALTPLQQQGQEGQQKHRQAGAEAGTTTTEALGGVLPAGVPLVDRWTADGQGITREQYEMHRRLHLAQRGALPTGAQGQSNDSIDEEAQRRADEAVKPPDDDEVAQTGVYAPTVELAFSAIWDGEAEGQRALERLRAASVEEAHARQQEARPSSSSSSSQPSSSHLQREKARRLAARLRAWVARGSYVDDVYGLPPELDKTLREAEGPEEELEEDEGAKEKRAKAIRRLEALQQHLVGAAEGATGTPRVSLDDVERFLRERR